MKGEMYHCPYGLLDDMHVVVVVHPIEIELERKVKDGCRANDDTHEGRRPLMKLSLDVCILDDLGNILGENDDAY